MSASSLCVSVQIIVARVGEKLSTIIACMPSITLEHNLSTIDPIIQNISPLQGEFIFVLKGGEMLSGLCMPKDDKLIIDGIKGNSETLYISNIDALGKLQWLIRRP